MPGYSEIISCSKNVSFDEYEEPLTVPVGSQKAYAQCVCGNISNSYSRLRTSSLTLHGIKDKQDVALLSDDRRENMRIVIRSSAFLVSSIGSGLQAKNSEYGMYILYPLEGVR